MSLLLTPLMHMHIVSQKTNTTKLDVGIDIWSFYQIAVAFSIISLHDRVVKKGVSFLHGNVSIITSSDLSDMHVISMMSYYRLDEGRVNPTRVYLVLSCPILCVDSFVKVVNML